MFALAPTEAIESILEAASSSIIAFDPQAKISFVNASAARLLKKSVDSLKEKAAGDIFNAKDCALIQKILAEDQRIINHETVIETTSGLKNVITNGLPLYDRLGDKIGAVIDLEDITERKRIEEEIKKRVADLEEMNKFMVGRELDMINLKREINALLKSQGKHKKY